MNHQFIEAHELIVKARESLRRGDKVSARQLGEQAALLMPDMEDVWLVLAASDPDPQDALAYAQKALEINPQSTRARHAIEWASSRVNQEEASQDRVQPTIVPNQVEVAANLPKKHAYQTAVAMPTLQPQGRNWLFPALLIGAGCLVVGLFALFALTRPAIASIVRGFSAAAPTQEILWAPVEIAKPGAAPIDVSALSASNPDNGSSAPGAPQSNPPLDVAPTATDEPTVAPTEVPTQEPTLPPAIPAVTETPGSMAMEIVADTPTSESAAPAPAAPEYAAGNGERWIDVDLTNQSVYAYEGDTVVNSFIVSTGTWLTPTVTGQYKIYVKIRSGNMHGPGYFLPDVPYIMYFYKGYGLHGTYWHHNFGT
ncbi:MAG TPA: L,D-transpeptidase family protein, partial [Anaerolineales bacterium]|nr:L,D-transpeptidase family protein [Anaerolineales bacterium]